MQTWDYLILTASHAAQADAYRRQLRARRDAGFLSQVRQALVAPDLEGRRIGSGGSTLECLRMIANCERARGETAEAILRCLRVLIVHAGGDSRRLPAYSPCGKIFVPIPGARREGLPHTLFDRLVPKLLALPARPDGSGQCVVAAGDALLLFDPNAVRFAGAGVTMLGSPATPEEASRHGVFSLDEQGRLRIYLQKPSPGEQQSTGAIRADGRAVLDIGITSMDAAAAAMLLETFGVVRSPSGEFDWETDARAALLERGVDLYREVCCAMGADATLEHYVRTACAAGSKWDRESLARVFSTLRRIPSNVEALPECRFLHFGSTRQLVESGLALMEEDTGAPPGSTCVMLNDRVESTGGVTGRDAWVEGCRIVAPLVLHGRNALIGVDVCEALDLPPGAAVDVVPWDGGCFVRCYGFDDSFKDDRFLGRPLGEWLAVVNATADEVWKPGEDRTLWTARVFPSEPDSAGYRRWLWMFAPEGATEEQKSTWREARRYSCAEIAVAADGEAFHRRREEMPC